MDFFFHNRNAIITANKLFDNSLVSFNTQEYENFPDCLQNAFLLSFLFNQDPKQDPFLPILFDLF